MRRYTYCLSLLVAFAIPTLFEGFFIIDRINLANLIRFTVSLTTLACIWDIWATRHSGKDKAWLYQFNPEETLGIKLFNLPIEEYFFIIITSLYIVFTWEAVNFASETGNPAMYLILPFVTIWTLTCVSIPFILAGKYKNEAKS